MQEKAKFFVKIHFTNVQSITREATPGKSIAFFFEFAPNERVPFDGRFFQKCSIFTQGASRYHPDIIPRFYREQ